MAQPIKGVMASMTPKIYPVGSGSDSLVFKRSVLVECACKGVSWLTPLHSLKISRDGETPCQLSNRHPPIAMSFFQAPAREWALPMRIFLGLPPMHMNRSIYTWRTADPHVYCKTS
jgi:hypothetical protein